jgi:hypothetical protein
LTGLALPAPAQPNAAPPVITTQPLSLTAAVGDYLMFTVGATGAPPLAYQWQFNGTNLPAATNLLLRLGPLGAAQAGAYAVVVTNIAGSVTSATASLTVQQEVTSWYFTQLYRFVSGTNGGSPFGGLVQAPDGNLYGVGGGGGFPAPAAASTAFRLTTSGTLDTIHQFSGSAGSASSGLIEGASGNFYGTTAFRPTGATTVPGSVFRMDTNGLVTTLLLLQGVP